MHCLRGDVLNREGRSSAEQLLASGLIATMRDECGDTWFMVPQTLLEPAPPEVKRVRFTRKRISGLAESDVKKMVSLVKARSVRAEETALVALGFTEGRGDQMRVRNWMRAAVLLTE